jgi:hypothetical protein
MGPREGAWSDVLRMGRYARASSWQSLRVTAEPSVSISMIHHAGKLFPRRTHFGGDADVTTLF